MRKWFLFVTDPFKKIMLLLLVSGVVFAEESLEGLSVMSLSAFDQVAVVKLPDGSMRTLSVGDLVPGTQAVLVEVLTHKLVLQELRVREGKPSVQQLVWVYQALEGQSQIQRLDQVGPGPIMIEKPTIIEFDAAQINQQ